MTDSPTPLDGFVVLDVSSGTFFGADQAYVFNTASLTPAELQRFNEGSDSDRIEIADRRGSYLEFWTPPSP